MKKIKKIIGFTIIYLLVSVLFTTIALLDNNNYTINTAVLFGFINSAIILIVVSLVILAINLID